MGSCRTDDVDRISAGDLLHLDFDVGSISSFAVPCLAGGQSGVFYRRYTLSSAGRSAFSFFLTPYLLSLYLYLSLLFFFFLSATE